MSQQQQDDGCARFRILRFSSHSIFKINKCCCQPPAIFHARHGLADQAQGCVQRRECCWVSCLELKVAMILAGRLQQQRTLKRVAALALQQDVYADDTSRAAKDLYSLLDDAYCCPLKTLSRTFLPKRWFVFSVFEKLNLKIKV